MLPLHRALNGQESNYNRVLLKHNIGYIVQKISSVQFLLIPLTKQAIYCPNNNTKRSHTQLDSRKQVIAFQDRVMTINIKEAQHPLK